VTTAKNCVRQTPFMDDPAVLRHLQGVVCLVVTANSHDVAIEGLILTPTTDRNTFRRVGMFRSTWPFRSGLYYTEDLARPYRSWYGKTMTTVTIV